MSGKRLLVVDDEPRFGEFVRKVAVDAGFEVCWSCQATRAGHPD